MTTPGPQSTYPATYPDTYGGAGGGGAGTASEQLTVQVVEAPSPPPVAITGPWRFLWGPAQPAGGAEGEIIQAQQRTVTLRTEPDQSSEASADIDGRSLAALSITELQSDLTVMYGRQIVFQGRLGASQDSLDASAHRLSLSAMDYREVLRRRALLPGDTLSFDASKDSSFIAWQLVQATQGRPGGDLGISPGLGQQTGITGTPWTFTAGDMIGDDITALAQAENGFEWQITPYGLADLRLDVFRPQMGQDRGVVLDYGGDRVSSVQRNVDPSTYANELFITSNSGNSLAPVQISAGDAASRPEGLWDAVQGLSLSTQGSLNAAARGALARAEVLTPSYTITLHPGTWGGPTDIWIGDTVTIWVVSGRLNIAEKLRVVEMAFDINASNVETLTLTLGALPFRVWKHIPRMLRRLRYLELR